jgi:hypothetical protein
VLPRPGLRDDPPLVHAAREQCLPDGVVDLVGAGVVQILALEHHGGADLRPEAAGLGDGRRAAHELGQELLVLGPERRIRPDGVIQRREVVQRRDQRLGHVASAVRAEPALHGALS